MAVGIIAEYNPFHRGHAHQISEIRKKIVNAEIIAVNGGVELFKRAEKFTPSFWQSEKGR